MILSNDGKIEFKGSVDTLMADVSMIVWKMKEMLTEEFDSEFAEDIINTAVKNGLLPMDKLDTLIAEKKKKVDDLLNALKALAEEE